MSGKVIYKSDKLTLEIDPLGIVTMSHDLRNDEIPIAREMAIAEANAKLKDLAPGANSIGMLKAAIERLKELVTADEA
jgi:hypothetical protein